MMCSIRMSHVQYTHSCRFAQRGVYPPEQFSQVPKYGLPMLVSNDSGLQEYLGNVTKMIRSKCNAKHSLG